VLYGYSEKVADEEYGLLQMREVTFAMSARDLKLVAAFLVHVAEQMESGETFLHRHIDEFVPEWKTVQPGTNLVVIPPESMVIPDIDS